MKKIFNILIIITLFLSMNLSVSSCVIAPEVTTEETEVITTEEEVTEETTEETTEEETSIEEDTEADIEKKYLSANSFILLALSDSLEKYGKASSDIAEGKISILEHKAITKKHIEEIKTIYDMQLELKPSKRLEKSHDLYCKAMDHLLQSVIYLQSYIEAGDMDTMIRYLEQATNEMNLYTEYLNKATEQMKKLY